MRTALFLLAFTFTASADEALKSALLFHVSFDLGADADFATGEKVMELMFALNQELGTTLVLVTHDRGIAQRCQHCITIEAGRVVPQGLPSQ